MKLLSVSEKGLEKFFLRKLILGIVVMMMLAASLVVATTGKMEIVDVEVTVSGDKETASEGETIEVKPEDSVKVKIYVENLYTEAEDMKLEDVTVTGIFEGIDDGDEVEEEDDISSIRPTRRKYVTLNYDIPLEVEEDSFTFTIEAEGEDENNTDFTDAFEFNIEVEKDKHKLEIYKAQFFSPTVKCGETADLSLGVINIGREEEEEIEQVIRNDLLGYTSTEKYTLREGAFDDDVKRTKSYKITVPEDAKEGVYQFTIQVDYGSKSETKYVDLNVECTQEEEKKEEETKPTTMYVCADGSVVDDIKDCKAEEDKKEEQKEEDFIPMEDEEEEENYTFLIVGSIVLVILIIAIVVLSTMNKN